MMWLHANGVSAEVTGEEVVQSGEARVWLRKQIAIGAVLVHRACEQRRDARDLAFTKRLHPRRGNRRLVSRFHRRATLSTARAVACDEKAAGSKIGRPAGRGSAPSFTLPDV